jgi:hypothetical protein
VVILICIQINARSILLDHIEAYSLSMSGCQSRETAPGKRNRMDSGKSKGRLIRFRESCPHKISTMADNYIEYWISDQLLQSSTDHMYGERRYNAKDSHPTGRMPHHSS